MRHGIIRVLSLSTPYPKRVHLMDQDGEVLCDNKHLKFCLETAHRGYEYTQGIPICTPCALAYRRLSEDSESTRTILGAYA